MPENNKINAKVAFATGGYTIGKAISVLLGHYVIGEVPPDVQLAHEFLIEGGCAFFGGYIKSA